MYLGLVFFRGGFYPLEYKPDEGEDFWCSLLYPKWLMQFWSLATHLGLNIY